ncbi:NAD-dependent epimerase/dehydratase family protein [Diaminobutyricibacter sp. McL0608]|uniref:NAD-dependent epimerase/dehydratase family protein n=1 Tax=Leifsonia sp. McL0608 TaxID=3143537 RepID=UPI0031F2EBA5
MRVLLAGASGTLGRVLVPRLLAAGHQVIGITRSPQSAERLRGVGAEAIVADVLDRDALLRALDGQRADAVIHELTALRKPPLRFGGMTGTNQLRETGTARLIEAAGAVGATRMLTQSIVFGYGFRRPRPVPLDESAPFGEPEGSRADPTIAALRSTESQVFDAAGIEGIALRYGLFYGLDADVMAPMLRRRMLPVADHDGLIPFVHHEDAAAATVAALERGVAGRAYNVADAGSSWRHYAEAAARAFSSPAPLVLPKGLLRAAFPYAAQLMTTMDLRVSSDLARRELAWTPRYASVEQGWAAMSTG